MTQQLSVLAALPGLEFSSQHPCDGSQPTKLQFQRNLMPSFYIHGHQAYMLYTDIYVDKTVTHKK